mmetsp:Transcript_26493/g.40985  ORF Transcript_26493/g.40985 Transcript_26493/m.40985 type:complete len:279 (+) Transcript_26493:67-903(+)
MLLTCCYIYASLITHVILQWQPAASFNLSPDRSYSRSPFLLHVQTKGEGASSEIESSKANDATITQYFITEAQAVHLGPAARILTEEFYSERTNFITFQIERLKTALSLESTFPRRVSAGQVTFKPLQQMFVAACSATGKVVGFAEVDARPLGNQRKDIVETASGNSTECIRSYMYNLAVDKGWKRKGIASVLVRACEEFVVDTHDACAEKRLYLRVRKTNCAAIGLYESLDYTLVDPESILLSKEDINGGSLEEGELLLFAKDLEIDPELCVLDEND